jgi:hypothetical protein
MAQMDDLPDLDIQISPPIVHLSLAPPPGAALEVKTVQAPAHTQTPVSAQSSTSASVNVPSDFPATIVIKRQRYPVPWISAEQEFIVNKHDINPDAMEKFDEFLNKNIPDDKDVRPDALKFVENVLLGRIKERKSKVFYDAPQYKNKKCCFVISFLFA